MQAEGHEIAELKNKFQDFLEREVRSSFVLPSATPSLMPTLSDAIPTTSTTTHTTTGMGGKVH